MSSEQPEFIAEFFIIPIPRPAFLPAIDLKSAVAIVKGRQTAYMVAEELERWIRGWDVEGAQDIYVLAETIYVYDEWTIDEIRTRIREYAEHCAKLSDDEIEQDAILRAHRDATVILKSLQKEVETSYPASKAGTPPRRPVAKPDGWTKSELVAQAKDAAGSFSASTFDNIRNAANVAAGERGGRGQQRRFSRTELAELIEAIEVGTFRNSSDIANSWRELLAQ